MFQAVRNTSFMKALLRLDRGANGAHHRAMRTDVIARSSSLELRDHRCSAGPDDRPFEEEHALACIALVRSGSFRYRSTTGTAALGPGALLLGNAFERYECSHEFGRGDRCLSFSFEPAALESVASEVGCKRFYHAALPPLPRAAALSALAMAAADRRDAGLSLEEIGYELLASALSAGRARGERATSLRDERRAMDATRWLHDHAAQPVMLADIASAVGASPFHLLRTFRRVVGTTPHRYLVAARLRRAVRLLVSTDRPVTEVAFDSGFGDLSNFIRTFRHAVGCSPRALRKIRKVRRWKDR